MKNIFRFLIALILGVVFIALMIIILPLILGVTFIFALIVGIIGFFFFIISFFAFFWYVSRKEPEIKNNNNYSIDQGRKI
jgi:archaellum biogenesis protein FlaJ (TadC family)